MAIVKAVITYDDGTVAEFNGTPAIPEVPAQAAIPLDLTTIPTQSPAETASQPTE